MSQPNNNKRSPSPDLDEEGFPAISSEEWKSMLDAASANEAEKTETRRPAKVARKTDQTDEQRAAAVARRKKAVLDHQQTVSGKPSGGGGGSGDGRAQGSSTAAAAAAAAASTVRPTPYVP